MHNKGLISIRPHYLCHHVNYSEGGKGLPEQGKKKFSSTLLGSLAGP